MCVSGRRLGCGLGTRHHVVPALKLAAPALRGILVVHTDPRELLSHVLQRGGLRSDAGVGFHFRGHELGTDGSGLGELAFQGNHLGDEFLPGGAVQ